MRVSMRMISKLNVRRAVFLCLWIAALVLIAFGQAVRAESESVASKGPDVAAESEKTPAQGPASAVKSEKTPAQEPVSGAESESVSGTELGSEPAAESSEDDVSGIDFVLVLDGSGTMAKSDPKGLTVEAARMFVDMLPNKNARVAVVEFGPNYGEDAYDAEKYTKYVSVPFPLSDITSIEQKNACKEVIAQTRQDGDYTPVGYAFQAACDVLQKGGATPENAGILLLSDFRVTGQRKEDFLEDGYSYQSLEDAESIAQINQWPVYTLEMNFDGKNDTPSHYTERIAQRIRSAIPGKTGYGEYIPLKKASDAQSKFAEIFDLFFDPNNKEDSEVQSQVTDKSGDAEFLFSVGDMVAELNITLTCADSDKIQGVGIGRGDQLTAYDMTSYQEPIQEEDRTVTKEDRYITFKLMLPPPGEDWKVIVHGDAETEIGMYTLTIHDMNLILRAEPVQSEDTEQGQAGVEPSQYEDQTEPGEGRAETDRKDAGEDSDLPAATVVDMSAPVHFTASYVYDGRPYTPELVYEAYPAVLEIVETGEQIPMRAEGSVYSADAAFEEEGTFTVKAVVSEESLRTGSIESGTCQVTVLVPETETELKAETEAETETEEETETEAETEAETETESEMQTEPVTEKKPRPARIVAPPPAPKPPKPSPPWYTDTLTLVMIGAAVVMVLLLILVIRRRRRSGK